MSIERLLDEVIGSVKAHDWDRLDLLLSERFFDHVPGGEEPTAAERLVPLVADLAAAVPDLEIRIDDLGGGGPEYRGTLSLAGTFRAPLWGAPPSGEPVEWRNPITLRSDEGRLAFRFDDVAFPELVGVLRQFGLVNAPDQMDQPPPSPVRIPEFLLKVAMTGQASDRPCSHLGEIAVTEPPTRACEQCVQEGVNWPALRMCLTCGHVGCCDTSRNKHARAHADEAGHPLMRSIRMDESWVWCYVDNAFFEGSALQRLADGVG